MLGTLEDSYGANIDLSVYIHERAPARRKEKEASPV
jgi:hypothetical protein